jgi:hypothetical protein
VPVRTDGVGDEAAAVVDEAGADDVADEAGVEDVIEDWSEEDEDEDEPVTDARTEERAEVADDAAEAAAEATLPEFDDPMVLLWATELEEELEFPPELDPPTVRGDPFWLMRGTNSLASPVKKTA